MRKGVFIIFILHLTFFAKGQVIRPLSNKEVPEVPSNDFPDSVKVFYEKALEEYSSENFPGAIKNFTEVLERQSSHVDALYNRALCFLQIQRKSLACEDWFRIHTLGKHDTDSLLWKYCKGRVIIKGDSGLKEEGVFLVSDSAPLPKIGIDELAGYFNSNFKFTETSLKDSVHGMIVAEFVVTREGKIHDPKIIFNSFEAGDAENQILTLVKEMSDWNPGKLSDSSIHSLVRLPIMLHGSYSTVLLTDPDYFFQERTVEAIPINMNEIKKRIGYPVKAKNANIQGTVFYRIEIDETGKVSNLELIKSAHPILDNAVGNVIKYFKWFPPFKNGHPVKLWFNMPFVFRVN